MTRAGVKNTLKVGRALILCVVGAAGAQTSEQTVGIGIIAPLTGPSSSVGNDVTAGAQLCLSEVKLEGLTLKILTLDDQNNTDEAKKLLNTFTDDPSNLALVGGSVSGIIIAATEALRSTPVATVGTTVGVNAFTDRNLAFVNRVSSRVDLVSESVANYAVQDLGIRNAVLIDDTSVYGSGFTGAIKKVLEQRNAKILEQLRIEGQNLDPVLSKVVLSKPDTVFLGFTNAILAGVLVKQLRASGYTGALFGGPSFAEKTFTDSAGDALTNLYYGTGSGPAAAYPQAKALLERFKTQYKRDASGFVLSGCDAARALTVALQEARDRKKGGLLTRADVIRALRRVSFVGQTGPIAFNRLGDRRTNPIFTLQYGKDLKPRVVSLEQVRPKN